LAIDIDCGTDQNTVLLTPYFQRIINIKIYISNWIIRNDLPHDDSLLTLIISDQAVQWFDLPYFYNEVKRVLKINGVFTLFRYAFV